MAVTPASLQFPNGTTGLSNDLSVNAPAVAPKPLVTVRTGFQQLTSSTASVPQVAAPSTGTSFRIPQGVDPQATLNAFSSASLDAAATTTGSTGTTSTPTTTTNPQGGSEVDEIKEWVKELRDGGEEGDDTILFTEASIMKSQFDKRTQETFDKKKKQREQDARFNEQMEKGEPVDTPSEFS